MLRGLRLVNLVCHCRTIDLTDNCRFADAAVANDASAVSAGICASDQVQQEDGDLCLRVQQGLQSRGYSQGRYAPHFEGA